MNWNAVIISELERRKKLLSYLSSSSDNSLREKSPELSSYNSIFKDRTNIKKTLDAHKNKEQIQQKVCDTLKENKTLIKPIKELDMERQIKYFCKNMQEKLLRLPAHKVDELELKINTLIYEALEKNKSV